MENLIATLCESARLTRDAIWSPSPPYIPKVRRNFSLLSRPGYVGPNWTPGGYVLVGSNGNSTEGRQDANAEYDVQDLQHAEHLRAFRDEPNQTTFHSLMNFERSDLSGWSLRSTIDQVLDRLAANMDDVAVLNVIPFSTLSSPHVYSPVWRNSVTLHIAPLLNCLQPSRIIWLGKAAFNGVRNHQQHLPNCTSHVVSRQRNLTWEEKLKEIPVLNR